MDDILKNLFETHLLGLKAREWLVSTRLVPVFKSGWDYFTAEGAEQAERIDVAGRVEAGVWNVRNRAHRI